MSNLIIIEALWGNRIFGINNYEVLDYLEKTLSKTTGKGPYSFKLDPQSNKTLAQKFGFYYCDTFEETKQCPLYVVSDSNENLT
jgi:hypothetical protein